MCLRESFFKRNLKIMASDMEEKPSLEIVKTIKPATTSTGRDSKKRTKDHMNFLIPSAVLLAGLYYFYGDFESASVSKQEVICRPGDGPKRFDPDLGSLLRKITKAFKQERPQDLEFWASCDFIIQQKTSKQQVVQVPKGLSNVLMKNLKSEDWLLPQEQMILNASEQGAQFTLASKSGLFELLFQKTSDKGWSWVGVTAQQEKSFRTFFDK